MKTLIFNFFSPNNYAIENAFLLFVFNFHYCLRSFRWLFDTLSHFSFSGTFVHMWEESKLPQCSQTRGRCGLWTRFQQGSSRKEEEAVHGGGEPEGQTAAETAGQYGLPSPDLLPVLLSPLCAQAGWHPAGMIIGQHPWDQRVGQREGGSSCACSGPAALGPTGAPLPFPSAEGADGFLCCCWAT